MTTSLELHAHPTGMSTFENPKEKIVTVYSKNGCKYCDKLKDRFKELKIQYVEKRYSTDDPSYKTDVELLKTFSKMNTFPMVYFGLELVGGYSEFIEKEKTYVKQYLSWSNIPVKCENMVECVWFDAEF